MINDDGLSPYPSNTDRTYVLMEGDNEEEPWKQGWLTLQTGSVNIPPGVSSELSLRLALPHNAPIGRYPFTLAYGAVGEALLWLNLELIVLPTPALALTVDRSKKTILPFRSSARFNLWVLRLGNTDTAFRIAVLTAARTRKKLGRLDDSVDKTDLQPLEHFERWTYHFDNELSEVRSPGAGREPRPAQVTLRVRGPGRGWVGFYSVHWLRVGVLPTTDDSNAGRSNNDCDLKVVRFGNAPSLLLSLFLLYVLGSSTQINCIVPLVSSAQVAGERVLLVNANGLRGREPMEYRLLQPAEMAEHHQDVDKIARDAIKTYWIPVAPTPVADTNQTILPSDVINKIDIGIHWEAPSRFSLFGVSRVPLGDSFRGYGIAERGTFRDVGYNPEAANLGWSARINNFWSNIHVFDARTDGSEGTISDDRNGVNAAQRLQEYLYLANPLLSTRAQVFDVRLVYTSLKTHLAATRAFPNSVENIGRLQEDMFAPPKATPADLASNSVVPIEVDNGTATFYLTNTQKQSYFVNYCVAVRPGRQSAFTINFPVQGTIGPEQTLALGFKPNVDPEGNNEQDNRLF